jgi:hypothetical protein
MPPPKLVDTSSILYTLPLPRAADVKVEKQARARAYAHIKPGRTALPSLPKLVDTSSILFALPISRAADVKEEKQARARAYAQIQHERRQQKDGATA